MQKILLLLSITVCLQLNAQTHQTLFDQLVYVNEQWKYQEDADQSLKLLPAKLMTEQELVSFHLQEVEKLLRNRKVDLPADLLQQRNDHLNTLHHYWQQGLFPINADHGGRQPYFIDHNNTYCAVGYLMKESGADEIARYINETQNYNYLFDIYHPRLMQWVSSTGLSINELALIQPSYGEWPCAVTELHYNNAGTDVNEYLEVNIGAPLMSPQVTSVKLYNGAAVLYKTILASDMQPIAGAPSIVKYYLFPSGEDFADVGSIELYAGTQLVSRYTYNESSVVLQDFMFSNTRTFTIGESESTPAGNSLTFCGHYYASPPLNLQSLPITIGTINPLTIMPLELSRFEATVKDKSVWLGWQTETETNTSHFIVERSIDGTSFKAIGEIKASGSTITPRSYSFTDNKPTYTNHYRLKQFDLDGRFSYSKIIYIKVQSANALSVVQNTRNSLQVNISLDQQHVRSLIIYDLYGREIKKFSARQGNQQLDISSLAAGKYLLQLLSTEGQVFYQSFIK